MWWHIPEFQPHLWPGELGGGAQHLLLGDIAVIVPAQDNTQYTIHTHLYSLVHHLEGHLSLVLLQLGQLLHTNILDLQSIQFSLLHTCKEPIIGDCVSIISVGWSWVIYFAFEEDRIWCWCWMMSKFTLLNTITITVQLLKNVLHNWITASHVSN